MDLGNLQSLAGQEVPVGDLVELNKALRKAAGSGGWSGNPGQANVGFPDQGAPGGVGGAAEELQALVPQSIQNTLDTATYTESAIQLWKMMTKVPVTSTLHETVRVNEYGSMGLDPWLAEGAGGTNSLGEYERLIVKVKYLAERREISDVATMVGAIGYQGVSRGVLAQQTTDGTRALLGKLERALFNGDSDLTSLGFDGLRKQILGTTWGTDAENGYETIGNTGNYTNKAGANLSPQDLIDTLYETFAAPNFGMVNSILVEPRVFGSLVQVATAHGRFDQISTASNQLLFGADGLKIAGPGGLVPVISCPLMQHPDTQISAVQGTENTTVSAAGLDLVPTAETTVGTSRWTAADAGTYHYALTLVSDNGATPVDMHATDGILVAAGKSVKFDIADGIAESGATGRYYRVFRSAKGGGVGGTKKWIGNWPVNTSGSGTNTSIIDNNDRQPGCSSVYFLQNTPDVMYWAQMLDFLRRPLAQVNTTIPFLLMLFGTPHVKVPGKNFIIDNVNPNL
jgi:hypothetical protein